MSGPALCMASWPSRDHDEPHVCLHHRDHRGPHICVRDEHIVPADADDEYWLEEDCGFMWPSSPKQMYMGAWQIDTAKPGDVVGDRAWPKERRIRITHIGRTMFIGDDVTHGNELAFRFKDFEWMIFDTEQA